MAKTISILLHPIFMPLLGVAILMQSDWFHAVSGEGKRFIYVVVLLTTLLIPLSGMMILKSKGWITSYFMHDKKERRFPLLIASFFYLIGAFILQKMQVPMIVPLFLNAASIVILISALITWQWKISIHMAALGGLAGMVIAVSIRWMANLQPALVLLFMLAGIAAYARLKLDEHDPGQTYAGYLLGLMVNFGIIFFI